MRNPAETWRRQPRLVRFLVSHVVVGFGVAAVFVGGFVAADPNGAGTVLLTAAGHWWPVVALWGLTGLTFGAVQFGAAMMLMAERGRPLRLYLIAGEHSGDALGAKLMAGIKARLGAGVVFDGVGGEEMAREGLVSLFPLSDVAVMGPAVRNCSFWVDSSVATKMLSGRDSYVYAGYSGFQPTLLPDWTGDVL